MKEMKREQVDIPEMKRKSVASKKSSIGMILACLGIMAVTVARGMKLDKEEALLQEETNEETEE